MFVHLQSEPFDPGAETNAFLKDREQAGAFVSFVGTVRSTPDQPIESMTLEHYPGLAQKQITRFATEAMERFNLIDIGVIHRFGTMAPGEVIVIVMALSAHRQAAFDGASYVMDWLKTDAPFWKRETGPNGTSAWVAAKDEDDTARDRWGTGS